MVPYVSIMIPVYNESKNLRSCFESLNKQTCKDFEVIFVDDGSSDNSWQLLEQLKGEYKELSVKLLKQKNQGAASARLTAAINASADYVLYHDCDDNIGSDTINNVANVLNRDKDIDAIALDVYIGYLEDGEHKYRPFEYSTDKIRLTGQECFSKSLTWGMHNILCVKTKIFIRANDTYKSYNPNLENWINNDEVIGRLCFLFCTNVERIPSIYYLNYNPNSTTKSINPNYYKILRNEKAMYEIIKGRFAGGGCL